MTVWARAVRCLMALALAVSGALLPSRVAAVADASTPRSAPATTANSAACEYDATAVARADVHANDTGMSVSQQEVGSPQVSAPPSARVLGASTTPSDVDIATEAASPGLSGVNRVGSALKTDAQHAFPDVVDNFATEGSKFSIPTKGPGGVVVRNSDLFQVEGSLNGKSGVFEWIVDQGEMTHRRFISGGKVTGYPNQVPTP